MTGPGWILLAALAVVAAVTLIWRLCRSISREPRLADACRDFHLQRERLEAKFIQLAEAHAGGGTLRWTDCQFDDDVAYVQNRSTGELSAFVEVSVPTEDPDRTDRYGEGLGPRGDLRAATVVFGLDRDHWETDGRAIFNLTPAEAIRFYRRDLKVVGRELAQRS